ncbi:hydroxymethylglutaryl-CoA reductase [Halioglobus sp. HI00S01]|uniref:hydroxymethylglutaryl-CoA reductase n=1 Tax=Halioglobus sp. HI00S01 TaxID=1822214 RepID=UPI0007C2FF1F|nr:hydroxymethylglutaryl-CoA reductase [Halioglobus sp. HI00S01]KZX54854.1 hydroxymethylglutaryl-CoA reductase [Halioglobus sp. HI00S01]
MSTKIPRSKGNDYTPEMIAERQAFLEDRAGTTLHHTKGFTFDPESMAGNCEQLFGVAQVPIGVAGPLVVNGEHAQGDFYVPMATIEGTLVASYNRGMRVIRESGGVITTVMGEAMQRAPVFMFKNARDARDFGNWVRDNFAAIKAQAESTTSVGKLLEIEQYPVHNMVYTRFDYSTGDAAGQNMTGGATFVACEWIRANYPKLRTYGLSGGMDTEKKTSFVNSLKGRGRKVTAEITIPRQVLSDVLRTTPEHLRNSTGVNTLAAFLTGASNNAAHPANGLAALFMATGQDMATIGEANQCSVYSYVNTAGDLYYSVTLPALIMATYGGGTGLATQRECLELMGCYGKGKAYKLLEIAAGLVVAGELSLVSATKTDKETGTNEWVDAHEKLGRNR